MLIHAVPTPLTFPLVDTNQIVAPCQVFSLPLAFHQEFRKPQNMSFPSGMNTTLVFAILLLPFEAYGPCSIFSRLRSFFRKTVNKLSSFRPDVERWTNESNLVRVVPASADIGSSKEYSPVKSCDHSSFPVDWVCLGYRYGNPPCFGWHLMIPPVFSFPDLSTKGCTPVPGRVPGIVISIICLRLPPNTGLAPHLGF